MTNIKKSIVILAAGLGSRYNGLKQIDGILENNAPILEYSIFDAIEAGFNKIVFIINTSIPQEYIDKISVILKDRNIEYHWIIQHKSDFVEDKHILNQREKPWGTGHALMCVQHVIKENFLVINADDYYGRSSYFKASELIQNEIIKESQYGIIAYVLKNTLSPNGKVARGYIHHDTENKMISVKEITSIERIDNQIVYQENNHAVPLEENTLVSMNFWVFNPSIFKYLNQGFKDFLNQNPQPKDEFFIPTFIDKLIQNGTIQVQVETSDEVWKGVTYANDKSELQTFLQEKIDQQLYPTLIWN